MASPIKIRSVYPRLAYSSANPESVGDCQASPLADQRHVCSESCDELYHVARAIEEADKAVDMENGTERRIHEHLAAMHANAAAELARQA